MRLVDYTIKDNILTAKLDKSFDKQQFLLVQLDKRPIREKQRKFFFAIITGLSDHLGYTEQEFRYELLYPMFEAEFGYKPTVSFKGNRDDINWMINLVINMIIWAQIPFKLNLANYDEQEIAKWEYVALKNKFGVTDGKKPSHLHHIDTVGMGNNRNEISNLDRRIIQLSPEAHKEVHTIGWKQFKRKYHVNGTIVTKELEKELGL